MITKIVTISSPMRLKPLPISPRYM